MLAKTVCGEVPAKIVANHIFLDRDPKLFDIMLNYLRHDGRYWPNDASEETKTLFELELKYWDITTDKLLQSKLPQELLRMLQEEPAVDQLRDKQMIVLKRWKEFGPLNLSDIHSKSAINMSSQLHYEEKQYDNGLYQGQFNAQKVQNGIGRMLYNQNSNCEGYFYEGQQLNGKKNGYGRSIHSSGKYYIGMWKGGERDGYGKQVDATGKVEEGIFEKGKFVGVGNENK